MQDDNHPSDAGRGVDMRGRPSKGEAAKTEVVTMRVTRGEKSFLEALGGSAAKGLRMLLDKAKEVK